MIFDISQLERFEGLRSVGYMAVLSGLISGPVAFMLNFYRLDFMSMDLAKLSLVILALGLPVVVVITFGVMLSDVIGSSKKRPDLNKSARAAMVLGGVMATVVHVFAISMARDNDRGRYLLFLFIFTALAIFGFIFDALHGRFRRSRQAVD